MKRFRVTAILLALVLAGCNPPKESSQVSPPAEKESNAASPSSTVAAMSAAVAPTSAPEIGRSVLLGEGVSAYESSNYPEALRIFRILAENGDAEAQFNLGKMCRLGQGMPEDKAEAVRWFRMAAEKGHTEAQVFLGLMLQAGVVRPIDYDEVTKWFRLAAEQGNVDAQKNLARLLSRPKNGKHGDDSQEAFWMRKAAEQGDPRAQNDLAGMYEVGRGVTKDKAEAMKWRRMAAEQGHQGAQYNLGLKYLNGDGVEVDVAEGKRWLALSAGGGLANANYKLAALEQDKPQLIIPVMLGESLYLQAENFLLDREIPFDSFRWIDNYNRQVQDERWQSVSGGPVFSKVWNAAGDYRIAVKSKEHPNVLEIIVRVIDPREKTENFGVTLGMPMQSLKEIYAAKGLDLRQSETSERKLGGRKLTIETFDAVPLERPFPYFDNIKYSSYMGVLYGFSVSKKIHGSWNFHVEAKPQEYSEAEAVQKDARLLLNKLNEKFGSPEKQRCEIEGDFYEWNTPNMEIQLLLIIIPEGFPTVNYLTAGFSLKQGLKGNVAEYFIRELGKAGSKQ